MKIETSDILNKLKNIHNDKYEYPFIFDEHKVSKSKITIICKECGYKFTQRLSNHQLGHGCSNCNGNVKKSYDEVLELCKSVHDNKFNYKYLVEDFKNMKSVVRIICNECEHEFKQSLSNHIYKKYGCSSCANNKPLTFLEFKNRSEIIHIDEYKETLYEYREKIINGNSDTVDIYCKKCGEYFKQRVNHHLIGHGCPNCKTSKGENKIKIILNEKNIKYITQHKFDDCKNIRKLPFDFYLPDYNMCIEFDGRQHFNSYDFFGGDEEYKKLKLRDSIKNNYCIENNIELLRIKYNENIIEKINEKI